MSKILTGKSDPFGGLTINTSTVISTHFDNQVPSVEVAKEWLESSLKYWKENKINGIWFEVDLKVR